MQASGKGRDARQPVVVTANRLRDGRVVWLGQTGWTEALEQARIVASDAATAALDEALASAARQEVVAAYLVDVAEDGTPAHLRERVRASGPTIAAA